MNEKILSTTTPTARKEHICAVCGKPIAKGEKYFNITLKADGKLLNRKTHYTCHYTEEKPLVPVKPTLKVDEFARNKRPLTEKMFKQYVKDDVRTMLEAFSLEENMQICFVPLLITECIWHYAENTIRLAAVHKVSETIKLSRTVKMLREEYNKEVRLSLSEDKCQYNTEKATEFMEQKITDFNVLKYSCKRKLRTYDLPLLDLRTEAYCAVALCELLARYNKKITQMIGERLGSWIDYRNPKIDALRECMEAYMSPVEPKLEGDVNGAIIIIRRKLSDIKFELIK